MPQTEKHFHDGSRCWEDFSAYHLDCFFMLSVCSSAPSGPVRMSVTMLRWTRAYLPYLRPHDISAGRLSDRYGSRKVVLVGGIIMAFGFFMVSR